MKNFYIEGKDIVVIQLNEDRNVLISPEDLEKVKGLGVDWRLLKSGDNEYAISYKDGKTIYMHREIMDCPKGFVVDHISGNGLDNTRENLRIVTQAENTQNLAKGAKSNSKSGVRNVFYDKYFEKWVTEVAVNGKTVYKKRFDHKADAEIASVMARAKYQPFSPEGTAIRKSIKKHPHMKKFVEYDV